VQKLKRRKWSISENSKNCKLRNPIVDKMNLLVQAPDKDELEEYFTLLQSLDYNNNGRLESNKED